MCAVSVLTLGSTAPANAKKWKRALGAAVAIGAGIVVLDQIMKNGQPKPKGKRSHGLSRSKVQAIQQALNDQGFDAGKPDGLMGRQTRSAIRQYQASIGGRKTGQLTRRQLKTLLNGSKSVPALATRQKLQRQTVGTHAKPISRGDRFQNFQQAIDDCRSRHRYKGGGQGEDMTTAWKRTQECEKRAYQNYVSVTPSGGKGNIYTSNGNAYTDRVVAGRHANDYQRAYEAGGNPLVILAMLKRAYVRGQLRGIGLPQRTILSRIKFSETTQPLINPRSGFDRMFANGGIAAVADLAQPGFTGAVLGENNPDVDLGRYQVGTLYEGELVILRESGRTSPAFAAITIDYTHNVLKSFFVGKEIGRPSIYNTSTMPAGDNLKYSDDVDMERLVTQQVDRRSGQSTPINEQAGTILQQIGEIAAALGDKDR